MNYPTHPNFTIQKIAREVSTKMDRGEDAYTALLSEAQRNNLTPEVLTSAIQYINNEIYLNHYKTASKGNPKVIKVDEVLNALNKKASVKTASSEDYNDLSYFTKKTSFSKTASFEDEHGIGADNVVSKRFKKAKLQKNLKHQKMLQKNAEYEANQFLTKTAMEISSAKDKLFNASVLALTRNEVSPEEIFILAKTALDEDVSETFEKALTKAKKTPKITEASKLAGEFNSVTDSEIIKWANLIVDGKDRLYEFNEKFSSIETACLRREGMRKLMEMSYGNIYN